MRTTNVALRVANGMKTISFDMLRSGSAGVRVTDDVPPLLWAVDLVMAVAGKNRDDAGWVLRNLKVEVFDSVKITETHLSANGGKKTKLVSFEHALELVMVLPGDTAKAFRVQACDVLKRYFAGDSSLHHEIVDNANSTAPLNVLARASLPEPYRDALMEHLAPLVPIVKQLTDEMVVLRADRDKERHMRHQADGRYGSDVREANKNVREQAEYWKKQSEAHEKNSHAMAVFWDNRMESEARRSAEKDNMILECHRMLVGRMRSRSPDSERRP